MRNIVHDIESGYPLLMKKINCVGILFAKYRYQHVCARNFFFSRGLHMQNRALDNALKTKSRLRIYLSTPSHGRRIFGNMVS